MKTSLMNYQDHQHIEADERVQILLLEPESYKDILQGQTHRFEQSSHWTTVSSIAAALEFEKMSVHLKGMQKSRVERHGKAGVGAGRRKHSATEQRSNKNIGDDRHRGVGYAQSE